MSEYEDVWEAVADQLDGVRAEDLRGQHIDGVNYVDGEPHTVTTLQIRDAVDAALGYVRGLTP